jgi:hypothetical protein
MHIRATKPLKWSGAMAIGHDQFDIFPIQSHCLTNEMTDHNVGSQNEGKVL